MWTPNDSHANLLPNCLGVQRSEYTQPGRHGPDAFLGTHSYPALTINLLRMAEYETVNSFPAVDQARLAARNYGRQILESLSTAYNATVTCMHDNFSHCFPSLRRPSPNDLSFDWEDDTDARWSDELERLLDTEGHTGEDSSNALTSILSRLPFIRVGSISYKPSAANLRRARNKSRSSLHSNGTGESLRSRADLFDHSGDEFEDAGMLPDEHIFALASGTAEEPHPTFMGTQMDVELQEEDRLAEQREEAILQIKRERAQRLAVKRGLSDALPAVERPKSSGQGSLRDAIPLRRGRSSTLQSQLSGDVVPLRGRASTIESPSSGGMPSPRIEQRSRPTSPPITTSQTPIQLPQLDKPRRPSDAVEETEFTEFVQSQPSNANDSSTLLSPISPEAPSQSVPELPSRKSPPLSTSPQEIQEGSLSTNVPSQEPRAASLSSPLTPPPKRASLPDVSTLKRPNSASSPPPKQNSQDRPAARRIPSNVPGDYDPVTGYYRRKSDADIRINDEDRVAETWKQSIKYLGKDVE